MNQPPSQLVCHLSTPDNCRYQSVSCYCSCFKERRNWVTKPLVGSFPWGQVNLFWEEFFESFLARVGLSGAAESSEKFYNNLREGRGFSEDCYPSGRCEEGVSTPLQGYWLWRGLVSVRVLFLWSSYLKSLLLKKVSFCIYFVIKFGCFWLF